MLRGIRKMVRFSQLLDSAFADQALVLGYGTTTEQETE